MPAAIEVPLRMEEGVMRVGQSRVTLQAVVADFKRGASPEEIAHHYPALTLLDTYLVVSYYLDNQAEVDAYIEEQYALAEAARREYETEFPPNDDLRQRLLKALAERRQQSE
jgi:uncharacterized protein (DUF433 family)